MGLGMILAHFYRAPDERPYRFEVAYFAGSNTRVVRCVSDTAVLLTFLSSAGLQGTSASPADRGTSPEEAAALIEALPHDSAGPIALFFQAGAFLRAVEALPIGV